jgi:nitrogenase-associated protein
VESLRPFFANNPVSGWFNESAPRVKSGELDLDRLNESEALDLMINDPILIKRPLMLYQSLMQSGFVAGPVLDFLGIKLEHDNDLQTCPMTPQNCETEQ